MRRRLAGSLNSDPQPVVGVAQLVELLVVVQAVVGSSPIAHPSEVAAKWTVSFDGLEGWFFRPDGCGFAVIRPPFTSTWKMGSFR